MDRDRVDFYCPNCGYRRTELFYAPDSDDFRAGDCQSANSEHERGVLAAVCPECGHEGFVRSREYPGAREADRDG